MQINTYDLVRTFEYWTYRSTIISVCIHNNMNRSIYLAHCKQINDLPRLLMLLIDVQLGIRHIASSKVFAVLHAALLQSAFHLRFLCATQRFTTYLSQLEYSTNSHEKKVYCIKMWKRPTLLHYFVQNFELPENQYAREYSFINIDVRSEWIEIRADVYILRRILSIWIRMTAQNWPTSIPCVTPSADGGNENWEVNSTHTQY